MRYASETTVSVAKSKSEIEETLTRYGASGFISGWQGDTAVIAFEIKSRRVKFILPMPDKKSKNFTHDKRGYLLVEESRNQRWDQACRQRWRALALAVKAKLETVETGISTFEDEFMAHIVLPDGRTVGEWMQPQIAAAYESGKMPSLLPYTPEN